MNNITIDLAQIFNLEYVV